MKAKAPGSEILYEQSLALFMYDFENYYFRNYPCKHLIAGTKNIQSPHYVKD